ncbi:DUF4350 domain-containing protein [Kroppenstedtia pulmonis]|uniref:DUF4350 domain-containing protein n=1 Tax=Kroppenstedtia pulmonis TaxID=1380685 RepID=A0A7D4CFM3_9BACL|nr:DUF4350 domain-containing protein [Kroppenstedtia pulmonis]QKG84434.1 DUF4350 domain-containing protein [Kroppenstedtia pulmonis]
MSKGKGAFLLIIGVVLIGSFFLFSIFLPSSYPPYSSESPARDGVKGLYRLLEKQRVNVSRWDSTWEHLPNKKQDVLFIVSPKSLLVPGDSLEHLFEWIERGNIVVLWAKPGDPMVTELGFAGQSSDKQGKWMSMESQQKVWLKEINRLYFPSDAWLSDLIELDSEWKDTKGKRRVGSLQMGAGSIYYIPDPDMITNRYIDRGDNLALPLYFASLAKGQVLFDEGVRKGALSGKLDYEQKGAPTSPTDLLSRESWLLLIQGVILFFFWIYLRGKRFANPRWETVHSSRSSDEYTSAMAGLYQWAELGKESLAIQLEEMLNQTSKVLGLPVGSSQSDIIQQTQLLMGKQVEDRLKKLIVEVENASPKVSGQELIRLSQKIYDTGEEIKRWKKTILPLQK